MKLTWANLLSGLRLVLLPVFILAVVRDQMLTALVVFAVAGLTDLLDGFVARSYQQQSKLGEYLDPAADKLLLTSAFLVLSMPWAGPKLMPFWVFLLVITRDLLIVIGALVIYLRIRFTAFKPLVVSKWNTAVQIIGVFAVLVAAVLRQYDATSAPLASRFADVSVMAVVALTVVSGLTYFYLFVLRYGDLASQVEGTPPSS